MGYVIMLKTEWIWSPVYVLYKSEIITGAWRRSGGRGICRRVTGMVSWMHGAVSRVRAGITVFVWASAQELSLVLPINATCAVDCRLTDVILGGPTKVKPTYIFVSQI